MRYPCSSASVTPHNARIFTALHAAKIHAFPSGAWFRGTQDGRLTPNAHGIVWLATDYETALSYGPRVLEVHLHPSADIIDLRDLSNTTVQHIKETASTNRERTIGRSIPDSSWASWADFGMLEGNEWVVPALLEDWVAGVVVADSRGTSAIPHDSLALLNVGVVSSWSEIERP